MDTPTTRACGLHAARVTPADYAANFGAAHPPLTRPRALIEAERCYYCHDAPCTTACPTGIHVPPFIQRIAQDNDPRPTPRGEQAGGMRRVPPRRPRCFFRPPGAPAVPARTGHGPPCGRGRGRAC